MSLNQSSTAAAYRSANWILVGKTQGSAASSTAATEDICSPAPSTLVRRLDRGRPRHRCHIYLKPLRPDWKTVLNQ